MFRAKVVLNGHAGPIYAASWDGNFLYSSSGDKYVTRWDLAKGLQDSSFTVKLEHAAYALKAGNQFCFIGCTDGTLLGIDTGTKKITWEHNFFGNAWFSLTIDTDRGWLAAGDSEGNLVILELQTGKRILHLPLAAGKIRALSIANDTCYVSTQLIGVLVFSCENWNELASWEPNELGSNVFLPNLRQNELITGGRDAHIVISSTNYEVIKRIPAHYQTIYGLIRVGDRFVTASMDKTIKVWSSDFSKVEQRIEFKDGGHNRSVNGLVFIDDQTFVSYGDDKKIVIWKKTPLILHSDN
jgi:WD40 repeat protein